MASPEPTLIPLDLQCGYILYPVYTFKEGLFFF